MHRFHSISIIWRFKFAALLLCLLFVMWPVALGFLIYSFIYDNRELTILGMGLIGGSIVLVVVQWLVAIRTRCPLCMTPVLASKSCVKHRKARRFLGSYRLRAALAILFRGWFHCPYCNEPAAMEVRRSKDSSQRRRR